MQEKDFLIKLYKSLDITYLYFFAPQFTFLVEPLFNYPADGEGYDYT
jgi:hypothetical protein